MSSITYILVALLALHVGSVLSAHISCLIAGGKDAYPGEFPYQVSIQYGIPPFIRYRPVCGGAIVNASWVVTSASCLTLIPKFGKIQVKAGKHQLKSDGEWVQAVEAPLRIVHSGYKLNILKAVKPNDIGLLKLKTPLQLNARVKRVVLPPPDEKPSGDAVITGWGSVSKNIIPQLPNVLQVANVTILSEDNCNDALKSLTNSEKILHTQICTGPLAEEVSACLGDLGDPLVQLVEKYECEEQEEEEEEGEEEEEEEEDEEEDVYRKNSPVLIGITSWSPYPCGQPGSPTIYTRVSSFVDWIEKRTSEN